MLLSNQRLQSIPVMSLQTGVELAKTSRILVDPRDLTILAYELDGHQLDTKPSFLRAADIRELSTVGFIVDSSDEFVGLDDVIKIKEVYEFKFDLVGLAVIDDKKHKLGKVFGFTVDAASYAVQQLIVKRPLLKSLNEPELIIHRSQIIEVNDQRVLVKAPTAEDPVPVQKAAREFTNPFRQPQVQSQSNTDSPIQPR